MSKALIGLIKNMSKARIGAVILTIGIIISLFGIKLYGNMYDNSNNGSDFIFCRIMDDIHES